MPRFGKDFKMYRRIVPSIELDITDVLEKGRIDLCKFICCDLLRGQKGFSFRMYTTDVTVCILWMKLLYYIPRPLTIVVPAPS